MGTKSDLDKRITLFVVDLDGEYWVTRTALGEAHFSHLPREERVQVLLVCFVGDIPHVQTT